LLFYYIKNPSSHLPKGTDLTSFPSANLFYQYALKNKMIPFIGHLANCQYCQKKIHPKINKKIKLTFKTFLALSLLQEQEKEKLGKILTKKKISVVLFKNFDKLKNFYPDSFCLQSDIDLFVNSKYKKKLDQLLIDQGYQKKQKKKDKDFEYGQKETHYSKISKLGVSFTAEVHYDILVSPKFHPSREAIVGFSNQALERAKKQANDFLDFSAEDKLLYLILHFYLNDFLQGLRNLYDIARFVELKKKSLNFNKLYKIAKRYQSYSIVIFVLGLVKRFFLPKLTIDKSLNQFNFKLAYFFYNPLFTSLVFTNKVYRFEEHRYQLKNFQVINSLVNEKVSFKTLWRIFRYVLPILVSRTVQNNFD